MSKFCTKFIFQFQFPRTFWYIFVINFIHVQTLYMYECICGGTKTKGAFYLTNFFTGSAKLRSKRLQLTEKSIPQNSRDVKVIPEAKS